MELDGRTIFKGDDTIWNEGNLLSEIEIESDKSLDGFTADFILLSEKISFNLVGATAPYKYTFQPNYTKEQTANFPLGEYCARLIIYDKDGRKYTDFTNLVYKVIDKREVVYAE